tara:strand:+ start:255 stop:701 length:447 start_codon:yes stop_codon:yes gene_type:complete
MVISEIENILTRDIQSLGCSIWGIEYGGGRRNKTLRIFIDKEEGVSVNDCERVSKHISKLLDTLNLSDLSKLEVSSPGLDRKFFKNQQYKSFLGEIIKVKYENGDKIFTEIGKLVAVKEDSICIKNDDLSRNIEFKCIKKANIEIIED